MGDMTVRNLPDEIHNHLRERAARNNRSVEAEVRSILTHAAIVASEEGFGQHLRKRFESAFGDELTVQRDKTAGDAAVFE